MDQDSWRWTTTEIGLLPRWTLSPCPRASVPAHPSEQTTEACSSPKMKGWRITEDGGVGGWPRATVPHSRSACEVGSRLLSGYEPSHYHCQFSDVKQLGCSGLRFLIRTIGSCYHFLGVCTCIMYEICICSHVRIHIFPPDLWKWIM